MPVWPQRAWHLAAVFADLVAEVGAQPEDDTPKAAAKRQRVRQVFDELTLMLGCADIVETYVGARFALRPAEGCAECAWVSKGRCTKLGKRNVVRWLPSGDGERRTHTVVPPDCPYISGMPAEAVGVLRGRLPFRAPSQAPCPRRRGGLGHHWLSLSEGQIEAFRFAPYIEFWCTHCRATWPQEQG